MSAHGFVWKERETERGERVQDYLGKKYIAAPFVSLSIRCMWVCVWCDNNCRVINSFCQAWYVCINDTDHGQNPASATHHSLVYQVITILRGSDHSLCLCGKLGIKHAPASGKHRGLSKGQFVSFNCCLSACLPNGIKLCRSFAFLKAVVFYIKTVNVITIGPWPDATKKQNKKNNIFFFSKRLTPNSR